MNPPSFPILGGTFTFRLIPSILTLLMLAALMGLGFWQLQRMEWKAGLIAAMRERLDERAVDLDLSALAPETVGAMDYHPVRASGVFRHEKEIYMSAISRQGDGGYHVLTPLVLEDGRVLLVDRGWLPYALKGKPDLSRPTGRVKVSGILRLPHQRGWMQPENKPAAGEWYRYDLKAMAGAAGAGEFLPYVLEADDALNRSGYPLGGQTRVELPNNHLMYAITWFALMPVLLVVYGVSGWRKV